MDAVVIIFGLLALMVVVITTKGLRIVKQAEVVIVERLGKFNRILDSGLHFIIPFFDQPRQMAWRKTMQDFEGTYYVNLSLERIDLRETVYDFPRQNVITKDNVNIEINGLIYFQITDPKKAIYEINNLFEAIEKLTQTTLRSVIGDMELDQCLSEREKINAALRKIVDDATDKWGVKVKRTEIQDIKLPEDIRGAMEKQMRAERERRAKILEAEGEKRSAVLTSEGQKEAAVRTAEGKKEAAILEAQGFAESLVIKATSEAESIRKVAEALGPKGDPTSYLIAVKYISTLQQIASGDKNKLVFMPYEATGLLGSLGSIKTMFKDSNAN